MCKPVGIHSPVLFDAVILKQGRKFPGQYIDFASLPRLFPLGRDILECQSYLKLVITRKRIA